MDYKIGRSVSLYSYQQEYYEGKLDLEGCIRETAKTGATGIELLAEQMIDSFPVITPEFKEKWFGWMETYHTEPTCYDAFLENHIYDNRTCTLREQIDMMKRDLRIAASWDLRHCGPWFPRPWRSLKEVSPSPKNRT